MSGFTELGFALIIFLSLSLLGLAAELIYLLHRRRRRWLLQQSTADPELGGGPSSGDLLLHVLCFEPRSRVEPACAAPSFAHPSAAANPASPKPPVDPAEAESDSDPEEDCDFDRWRATYLGPSRALYTINEEEEDDDEHWEEAEEEETPFATPCSSPGFYTPSPSPPRTRE
nr:PREDICTED: uncharacterized protein LOC108951533 [Musa acuminata subsp. malaccensis]XP_018675077.1 PREDICTED: uncharacterized protein LOC108951533 [Musa acuminata subsp. malaccensis]XP_018675078.1 PREDICTED: uncharacterized protein LOC108951533 [Musa acuminata subsp. malaccensis]XP_018675079.1 PREDICTED: uncharacterized protein LOC108951533 [Musa acuminata subsp. malaccensis]XP_018675080.1 PREDICTED: uncharacterized protein LOC108951533 [Musa acuminata subsp. malaccensis]